MKRLFIGLLIVLFLQGCTVFGVRNYELLSYDVIEEEGNFQIRQYQDFVAATTTTEGSYQTNRKVAHDLLFDYITGENVANQNIDMTAPVLQKNDGVSIDMTAPVIQKKNGEKWTMSFVLPSEYTMESAPKPLDSRVSVEKTAGKKVAVVIYNGSLTEEAINQNTERLIAWVSEKGLDASLPAYSAGYDPPWTLPWLKRNEVLIDLN